MMLWILKSTFRFSFLKIVAVHVAPCKDITEELQSKDLERHCYQNLNSKDFDSNTIRVYLG